MDEHTGIQRDAVIDYLIATFALQANYSADYEDVSPAVAREVARHVLGGTLSGLHGIAGGMDDDPIGWIDAILNDTDSGELAVSFEVAWQTTLAINAAIELALHAGEGSKS